MRRVLLGAAALVFLLGCELPMVAELDQAIADNPLDTQSPNYQSGPKFLAVYFGSGFIVISAKLDPDTGALSSASSENIGASSFNFLRVDPTGSFAIGINTGGGVLPCFRIDKSTGALVYLGELGGLSTTEQLNAVFDGTGSYLITHATSPDPLTFLNVERIKAYRTSTAEPLDWGDHSVISDLTADTTWAGLIPNRTLSSVYTSSTIPGAEVREHSPDASGNYQVDTTVAYDDNGSAFGPMTMALDANNEFLYAFGSGTFNAFSVKNGALQLTRVGSIYNYSLSQSFTFTADAPPALPRVFFNPAGTFAYFLDASNNRMIYRVERSSGGNLVYSTHYTQNAMPDDMISGYQRVFRSDGSRLYVTTDSAGAPYLVNTFQVSSDGALSNRTSRELPPPGPTYTYRTLPGLDPDGHYAVSLYGLAAELRLASYATSDGSLKSTLDITSLGLGIPPGSVTITIAEVY